jgi:hypothetical protein
MGIRNEELCLDQSRVRDTTLARTEESYIAEEMRTQAEVPPGKTHYRCEVGTHIDAGYCSSNGQHHGDQPPTQPNATAETRTHNTGILVILLLASFLSVSPLSSITRHFIPPACSHRVSRSNRVAELSFELIGEHIAVLEFGSRRPPSFEARTSTHLSPAIINPTLSLSRASHPLRSPPCIA